MEKFDVIILGTGLSESILAAALAKNELRVLQIDQNAHYGDHQASLSPSELNALLSSNPDPGSGSKCFPSNRNITGATRGTPPTFEKSFSLPLQPSLFPSSTSFITSLIQSGVSRYTSFKLLDETYLYSFPSSSPKSESNIKLGQWQKVPTSKSSIFTSPSSILPLQQKRKLMRLIQLLVSSSPQSLPELPEVAGKENMNILEYLTSTGAGGGLGLREDVASSVIFSLGFCETENDPSLETLLRIQKYLHSAGRYGDSPFLVGYYGGLGEIVQGFCRMAAVHGATYILGHSISRLEYSTVSPADPDPVSGVEQNTSTESMLDTQTRSGAEMNQPSNSSLSAERENEGAWKIALEGVPDTFEAKILVSSPRHLPPSALAPAAELGTAVESGGEEGRGKGRAGEIMAYCIAIYKVDSDPDSNTEPKGEAWNEEDQKRTSILDSKSTSLRIFPPHPLNNDLESSNNVKGSINDEKGQGHDRAVYVLLTGSDTLACPSSHVIAQLQTRISSNTQISYSDKVPSAEEFLSSYLTYLSSTEPVYTAFFTLPVSSPSPLPPPVLSPSISSNPNPETSQSHVPIVRTSTPPLSAYKLPEIGDSCLEEAKRNFWEVRKLLGRDVPAEGAGGETVEIWPPREDDGGDES